MSCKLTSEEVRVVECKTCTDICHVLTTEEVREVECKTCTDICQLSSYLSRLLWYMGREFVKNIAMFSQKIRYVTKSNFVTALAHSKLQFRFKNFENRTLRAEDEKFVKI